MPKSKSAKKVMQDFKDQYGEEEGESTYYATAKKQGRDPDTFKKEDCLKLVNDVVVEINGSMVTISAGTKISETVGTGAIAMVPNALGEKKKKRKKKVKKEASNSQISKLNLDY